MLGPPLVELAVHIGCLLVYQPSTLEKAYVNELAMMGHMNGIMIFLDHHFTLLVCKSWIHAGSNSMGDGCSHSCNFSFTLLRLV